MRMKTSLETAPRPRAKRSTAQNCLIINQFATPGLGSLMAGHLVAGSIQLLLAVAGFGCVLGWFIQLGFSTYRLANDLPPEPERYPWLGKIGFLLFALAWLLAWFTTIAVMRESRNARTENITQPIPPII